MTMDITPEQESKEEEIAVGLLAFTVGGRTLYVPELKRTANRGWQARQREVFGALASLSSDTAEGQEAMSDAQCQLILLYDATHVLGDLEDATDREIDAIYLRIVEVSYPLAKSAMALTLAIMRAAIAVAQANSTNGPSPTGTSAAPMILTPLSRSVRRASSSRRRKSA